MPSLELDPRILGQRISEARKARGKTQEEVAEFLGYSRPTYIAIEKGERQAKADEIIRLATFLGRTVNELVRPVKPVTDFSPTCVPSLKSRSWATETSPPEHRDRPTSVARRRLSGARE